MSEQRFYYIPFYYPNTDNIMEYEIRDKENEDWAIYINENDSNWQDMLVDLLNEQQSTISHLEKVYGENFAKRRLLEQDNLILRKENEQLRKEVKNRSAFIIDKGLGDTFVRWKYE